MKKPKKKNMDWNKHGLLTREEYAGYNEAIDEYELWLNEVAGVEKISALILDMQQEVENREHVLFLLIKPGDREKAAKSIIKQIGVVK